MAKYLIITEVGQVVEAASAEMAEATAEANITLGADANVSIKSVGASTQASVSPDLLGQPAPVSMAANPSQATLTNAHLKAYLKRKRHS